MKNNILLFSSCLLTFLLLVNFSAGPGVVANRALTTAPGETGSFCAQAGCHGSGAFNQTTIITVKDSQGQVIDSYEPGEDYEVTVEINAGSGDPAAYGFQMVALIDADDTGTNSWSDIPNTVHQVSLLSRDYVEHDGPNTTGNTFTLDWTAPEVGAGSVTFYAAGNAVNLNGSSSGDDADTTRLTLTELISSSVDDLNLSQVIVNVFPNPVTDVLNLSFEKEFEGKISASNLVGQKVLDYSFKGTNTSLNLTGLTQGLYLLRLHDQKNHQLVTKRIMKD